MSDELTTTLARAMVTLARRTPAQWRPVLAAVPKAVEPVASAAPMPTQQRP